MSPRLRRIAWIVCALCLSAALALSVGALVERNARDRFALDVAADARLRQALLASEIARFRLLPLALAEDRDLVAAVRGTPRVPRALDLKLEALGRSTGAAVIYVVGRDGRTLASSNWRSPGSFVGRDYRFRRYYRDAVRTGRGEQFALGSVSGRPGLYLARRTPEGAVVVVKLEFDEIERQWRAAGGITFTTDRAGVILVTSRPEWRFAATRPLDPRAAAIARTDAGVAALRARPFGIGADGLIQLPGERGTLLLAATPPDGAGWRVQLALPTRTAIGAVARTAQIMTALAVLALVALAWALRERARRRQVRTAALETAVAEATLGLRREMDERASAEARAADLREGLRQANRLATLGQVTASVAHETAQPVAAIRTYAANGELLLDRGALDDVRGNLRAIGRLTERIGTVTDQLRGFARKGSGEIGPIALADVIEGAQLILKERLSRVTLTLPEIPAALCVIAGRVRLEQVLVNLLQNAIEALDGRDDPRIAVTISADEDIVRLAIADNGPGVAPEIAARIFTPFATSRANGLGLGLVIAQDIMADLGGSLRLLDADDGAIFELVMRRAR